MNDNVIAKGYNLLKWGVLLSAFHINFDVKFGGIQIVPEWVAFIIVAVAINNMNRDGGKRYYANIVKPAKNLIIIGVVQFVVGFLFGYSGGDLSILSRSLVIMTLLYEALVYSDILNMTVRLYKDNGDMKSADKLRKDRMTFIKAALAISVLSAAAMVPALTMWLDYACFSLTLVYKLWLSMLIQNVSKKQLKFMQEEEQTE